MNPLLKEHCRSIRRYFGPVKHSVRINTFQGKTLFDIEYEDFKNENNVEKSIRKIIGCNYLLNIKRYCSEKLMVDIRHHYGPASNRKTLHEQMAEYEYEEYTSQ